MWICCLIQNRICSRPLLTLPSPASFFWGDFFSFAAAGIILSSKDCESAHVRFETKSTPSPVSRSAKISQMKPAKCVLAQWAEKKKKKTRKRKMRIENGGGGAAAGERVLTLQC